MRLVETLAYECGATVVMGGVVITGIMTPFERYGRWAREVHMRAGLAGGKFPIPPGEMLPLSAEEVERIRLAWAAIEDEERKSRGIGEDEEFELELDLAYFCLRNAEVRAGLPATWLQVPYLLLRTAAVDAFFPSIAGQ
ncbi:MAG: hypothetical protein ACREMX_11210 [Gemmatimonadales bacterium]